MHYKITTFFKITHHLRNYYDLLRFTIAFDNSYPINQNHKDYFNVSLI